MSSDAAEPRPTPRQRISPITVPANPPALAPPGEGEPQAVRDAFRETSFTLAAELRWLLDALGLQHAVMQRSGHSRLRNRRFASALLFWSRVYRAGDDLLRLTTRASYGSCPALLRSAFEALGAEQAVVGEEQVEFEDWLREAWRTNAEHHATEIGMGQYMAGQQIAMSPETGEAYRAVSELARPHFGASALLSAAESHDKRFLVNWADQQFHFGWAQLLLGWQIVLQDRQCRFAIGSGLFGVESEDRAAYQQLHRRGQALLEASGRCSARWIVDQGRQRLVIENFRRQPSGAPKRLLL